MPRREDEASPRSGPHLDEGTAHAWLDGGLPADEATRTAAHVAGCAACAALVAEAQGLLAGASRILGALDAVPGGVLPADPAREAARDAALSTALAAAAAERRAADAHAPRRASRGWWMGVPARAAAAMLVVAGLGAALVRRDGRPVSEIATSTVADTVAAPTEAVAPAAPAPTADRVAADAAVADAAVADAAAAVVRRPARGLAKATAGMPASDAAPAAPQALAATGQAGRADRRTVGSAIASLPAPPSSAITSAPPSVPPPVPTPAPTPVVALANRLTGAAVVAGRITSDAGAPLPGAQVQVVGTSTTVATDDSGRFAIAVTPGTVKLQARRIGFEGRTTSVDVGAADTTRVPLVLRPQMLSLSGVVVTGAASGRLDAATAGCYRLAAGPEGATTSGVGQLALDERPAERPAERRAGRQAYAARLVPAVVGAEWSPLSGDSVRVAWPTAEGGVVLRLGGAGRDGVRQGTALRLRTDGAPREALRRVVARPVACPGAPR